MVGDIASQRFVFFGASVQKLGDAKVHEPTPRLRNIRVNDLMYEIVRDRRTVAEGLSTEDVNSFVSLYRLANGTVYGRVPSDGTKRGESTPPSGPHAGTTPSSESGRGTVGL